MEIILLLSLSVWLSALKFLECLAIMQQIFALNSALQILTGIKLEIGLVCLNAPFLTLCTISDKIKKESV